jgi:two-component system phosphate regulon response regulator OmpR
MTDQTGPLVKPAARPAPADDAAHLLLVDDDRRIRALMSRYLGAQGYRVTTAQDAAEARKHIASFAFDLLILDVMMPGENGFDLAISLRRDSQVPILMLTARSEAEDRVRGFEAGADDYLSKPFEPKELSLRIASILRRTQAQQQQTETTFVQMLRFGDFVFDVDRAELRQGDEVLKLTDRERHMLKLLAQTPGEPVSRETLAGDVAPGNERTIDVQMNRLRRKIERDPADPLYIQTARGAGYRLVVDR